MRGEGSLPLPPPAAIMCIVVQHTSVHTCCAEQHIMHSDVSMYDECSLSTLIGFLLLFWVMLVTVFFRTQRLIACLG